MNIVTISLYEYIGDDDYYSGPTPIGPLYMVPDYAVDSYLKKWKDGFVTKGADWINVTFGDPN